MALGITTLLALLAACGSSSSRSSTPAAITSSPSSASSQGATLARQACADFDAGLKAFLLAQQQADASPDSVGGGPGVAALIAMQKSISTAATVASQAAAVEGRWDALNQALHAETPQRLMVAAPELNTITAECDRADAS